MSINIKDFLNQKFYESFENNFPIDTILSRCVKESFDLFADYFMSFEKISDMEYYKKQSFITLYDESGLDFIFNEINNNEQGFSDRFKALLEKYSAPEIDIISGTQNTLVSIAYNKYVKFVENLS